MTAPEHIWVVVPAYNEATVIASVVAGVYAPLRDVVVVDDCSTDDTSAVAAAAGATVLRHPVNFGQGAALRTGITWALRHGANHVITFDADGQHRPEDIESLLAVQRATGADLVQGIGNPKRFREHG